MIVESRFSSDLASGFLGGFFSGMVKQNGQKSDSIDEKRKTVYFQTHFNNAYKRSRPYAICDMHYKCILLRTYYVLRTARPDGPESVMGRTFRYVSAL